MSAVTRCSGCPPWSRCAAPGLTSATCSTDALRQSIYWRCAWRRPTDPDRASAEPLRERSRAGPARDVGSALQVLGGGRMASTESGGQQRASRRRDEADEARPPTRRRATSRSGTRSLPTTSTPCWTTSTRCWRRTRRSSSAATSRRAASKPPAARRCAADTAPTGGLGTRLPRVCPLRRTRADEPRKRRRSGSAGTIR